MYELGIESNFNETKENSGFDPLPAGEYPCIVTEAKPRTNKSNTGKLLELTYVVEKGDFKGRKVWQYINFKHENKKTQDIGEGELKSLVKACGMTDWPELATAFIGKPVIVKVGIKEDRNVVKKVSSVLEAKENTSSSNWG